MIFAFSLFQHFKPSDRFLHEAINDLSEDVRSEIDAIYQAIAALSVKVASQEPQKPRKRIGFKIGQ